MVQMIQVFMEDYTNARIGISFIETSEAVRRELAKKVLFSLSSNNVVCGLLLPQVRQGCQSHAPSVFSLLQTIAMSVCDCSSSLQSVHDHFQPS